jgi:predicted ABC-type ATPase
MPNLFVIAGPNGAGKSTTAPKILVGSRSVKEFVNADTIAADIETRTGVSADFRAGRIMLQRLDKHVGNGDDLAFEATLASRSLLRRIASMREAGYLFHLIYLWLPSAEMAVERVAARVRGGGHSVPELVVRRRYGRSVSNFFRYYRPIADSWLMLDNSELSRLQPIAWRNVGGPLHIVRQGPWEQLRSRYETDPFP